MSMLFRYVLCPSLKASHQSDKSVNSCRPKLKSPLHQESPLQVTFPPSCSEPSPTPSSLSLPVPLPSLLPPDHLPSPPSRTTNSSLPPKRSGQKRAPESLEKWPLPSYLPCLGRNAPELPLRSLSLLVPLTPSWTPSSKLQWRYLPSLVRRVGTSSRVYPKKPMLSHPCLLPSSVPRSSSTPLLISRNRN